MTLRQTELLSGLMDDLKSFEASMRAELRIQRVQIVVAVALIFTLDRVVGRLLT